MINELRKKDMSSGMHIHYPYPMPPDIDYTIFYRQYVISD